MYSEFESVRLLLVRHYLFNFKPVTRFSQLTGDSFSSDNTDSPDRIIDTWNFYCVSYLSVHNLIGRWGWGVYAGAYVGDQQEFFCK